MHVCVHECYIAIRLAARCAALVRVRWPALQMLKGLWRRDAAAPASTAAAAAAATAAHLTAAVQTMNKKYMVFHLPPTVKTIACECARAFVFVCVFLCLCIVLFHLICFCIFLLIEFLSLSRSQRRMHSSTHSFRSFSSCSLLFPLLCCVYLFSIFYCIHCW